MGMTRLLEVKICKYLEMSLLSTINTNQARQKGFLRRELLLCFKCPKVLPLNKYIWFQDLKTNLLPSSLTNLIHNSATSR